MEHVASSVHYEGKNKQLLNRPQDHMGKYSVPLHCWTDRAIFTVLYRGDPVQPVYLSPGDNDATHYQC